MTTPAFRELLEQARAAHARVPALAGFCAFADDLAPAPWTPRHIPPAELMTGDAAMAAPGADPLAAAFIRAAPDAFWRLTYKGTGIRQDFLDRFACYCLIGEGGPWISRAMSAYVVYMPPGLWYPFHHRPAEEIYYVLAGEAVFHREGAAPETLRAGGSSFHASMRPHATETRAQGFMGYVAWRNRLDTPPVLTDRPVNPAA